MKKIFLIGFLFFLLFLPLLSVKAQCPTCTPDQKGGLVPCGRNCDNPDTRTLNECVPCQLCHFFVLFKNIVDFLLTRIVPPLAVLMLAIGGFMYVFAYLSPAEVLPGGGKGGPALLSQAKKLIISVIFGLLIIFAAWLIVNLFFQMIGVQRWTRLTDDPATSEVEGWWKIDCP